MPTWPEGYGKIYRPRAKHYAALGSHYAARGPETIRLRPEGSIMGPEGSIMWPVGGIFSRARGLGGHITNITCKGRYYTKSVILPIKKGSVSCQHPACREKGTPLWISKVNDSKGCMTQEHSNLMILSS